jgi:hypothetical protein
MSDWISDLCVMSLNPLTNIRVIMVNVGKGMVPMKLQQECTLHVMSYEDYPGLKL